MILGLILGLISTFALLKTDLTATVGFEVVSYNWLKIVVVIALLLGSISPIAVSLISVGSRIVNLSLIEKGLVLIRLMVTIGYVLLGIAVLFAGFGMLMLIFRAFIIVLIFGVVLYFIFLIYYKFLNATKEFIDGIIYCVGSDSKKWHYIPSAGTLKPYLILFLVVYTINRLFQMRDSNDFLSNDNQELAALYYNLDKFTNIEFVLSLGMSLFVIYLLGIFDSYIRVPQPKKK